MRERGNTIFNTIRNSYITQDSNEVYKILFRIYTVSFYFWYFQNFQPNLRKSSLNSLRGRFLNHSTVQYIFRLFIHIFKYDIFLVGAS